MTYNLALNLEPPRFEPEACFALVGRSQAAPVFAPTETHPSPIDVTPFEQVATGPRQCSDLPWKPAIMPSGMPDVEPSAVFLSLLHCLRS